MARYQYIAIDRSGRRVTGEALDESLDGVIARLRGAGQFPTQVRPADERPETSHSARRPRWFQRISTQDVAILGRQLANLVRGGLPIVEAFRALTNHTENPMLRKALSSVRADVEEGSTLWQALANQPQVFSPLFVSMVRAGEASGELPTVLEWLAALAEQEQARRSQMRAATAYPKLLVVVGASSVFFLLTFMIPRFVDLFAEMEQALPAPTLVLMSVCGVLSRTWYGIAAGLVATWLGCRHYAKSGAGRSMVDDWKLRVPVFGSIGRKTGVARFSRTLGMLLRSGVPMLEALSVAQEVFGNWVLAAAVGEAGMRVREGERLGDALRASGLFPGLLTQMIDVGEQTGDLGGALQTVATTFEVEVDSQMKSALALLEPAIILAMGAVVAFLIMAMIWPLFELNPTSGG